MRFIITSLLCFCTVTKSNSQLMCYNADAQFLVQEMLAGYGIVTYDYSMSGSIGWFTSENTILEDSLGVTGGVILTTGSMQGAYGPNDDSEYGIDNGFPGEVLMTDFLFNGYQSTNVAIMRFKAYSLSDTMKFQYIFGSDGYPEDEIHLYADGMGIFLDGFDYCARNFALVTSPSSPPRPITCVYLNGSNHPELYIHNGNGGAPQNGSNYYIQYDGFTRVMTASAPVIPYGEYEVTIAVADRTDWLNDSGVFLPYKSLVSSVATNVNTNFTISPNPATDFLEVYLDGDWKNVKWTIVDLNGKDLKFGHLENSTIIDVSELEIGNYFLVLNSPNSSAVKLFNKF